VWGVHHYVPVAVGDVLLVHIPAGLTTQGHALVDQLHLDSCDFANSIDLAGEALTGPQTITLVIEPDVAGTMMHFASSTGKQCRAGYHLTIDCRSAYLLDDEDYADFDDEDFDDEDFDDEDFDDEHFDDEDFVDEDFHDIDVGAGVIDDFLLEDIISSPLVLPSSLYGSDDVIVATQTPIVHHFHWGFDRSLELAVGDAVFIHVHEGITTNAHLFFSEQSYDSCDFSQSAELSSEVTGPAILSWVVQPELAGMLGHLASSIDSQCIYGHKMIFRIRDLSNGWTPSEAGASLAIEQALDQDFLPSSGPAPFLRGPGLVQSTSRTPALHRAVWGVHHYVPVAVGDILMVHIPAGLTTTGHALFDRTHLDKCDFADSIDLSSEPITGPVTLTLVIEPDVAGTLLHFASSTDKQCLHGYHITIDCEPLLPYDETYALLEDEEIVADDDDVTDGQILSPEFVDDEIFTPEFVDEPFIDIDGDELIDEAIEE
jgi:hypothetical protein